MMAAQQADFFCPSTQEMSDGEPGIDTTMLGSQVVHVLVWILDPSGYARKGLVNNLAHKCLEGWNADAGVDAGKTVHQP